MDVSSQVGPCEHDVAELLDCSQLVEGRLVKELASDIHHLGSLEVVSGDLTLLEVGHEARVLVSGVLNLEVNSLLTHGQVKDAHLLEVSDGCCLKFN